MQFSCDSTCTNFLSVLQRYERDWRFSSGCFHLSDVFVFVSSPLVSVTPAARLERRKVARLPQRAYSSTTLSGSSREQTPSSAVMLECFSRDMTAVCRRNASLPTKHSRFYVHTGVQIIRLYLFTIHDGRKQTNYNKTP